jgi:dipeptidyl aminopeptidase/acylaminoacyl peptidase
LALINLDSGTFQYFDNIGNFKFSEDSKWIVFASAKEKSSDNKKIKIKGNDIILRHLETGAELPIKDVTEYAFDTLANYFVYVIADPEGKRNGLYYIKLQGLFNFPQQIINKEKTHYSNLTWNNNENILAFISAKENKDNEADTCALMYWDSRRKELKTILDTKDSSENAIPKGWFLPFKNELKWTKDGFRLFFGLKPLRDTLDKAPNIKYTDSNYYAIDTILKERDLDLWHWNDPRIKTHEKTWWNSNKDRVFQSVYHLDAEKWVQLANLEMPDVQFTDNPNSTLGFDELPYLKAATWSGGFQDVYFVDLMTGSKKLVVKSLNENARLSPNANFVVYFKDKHWYSYNTKSDSTVNLTSVITTLPFYDTEFDEPSDPPSYGFGGWIENDAGMLLYDKYDIWKFFSMGEGYLNMTAADGRLNKRIYRVINLDPDKKFFQNREDILVSGYNDVSKTSGLFRINLSILGPETVINETNKISVISKAKGKYKLLFNKQTYTMFPDLWVSDSTFSFQFQVSNVHPELKDYNFGVTEQIYWVNEAGDSLSGWVIKPENMEKGKKYPMLVYFYDRFSNYYNNFFIPKMNHRPCYPIYTGKGYVIFHPDIKYRAGNPGLQATDCIVSGVKEVLKQAYVDSTKIGIQGHSWGGYQTAFIVTQTNMFAAAVAGAPVGNMTSAYSGIRWGTGLARQFQYEKFQSRIGGTLWDSLDNYLRNSPVFSADKIKTPFMLMFGDEDWAVPWEQGIEIYLAMRRLNKQCIFLQYRNEPHWPEKYPNKLDYSVKMMEFYDHYLLGAPAPEWLIKGMEYKGR